MKFIFLVIKEIQQKNLNIALVNRYPSLGNRNQLPVIGQRIASVIDALHTPQNIHATLVSVITLQGLSRWCTQSKRFKEELQIVWHLLKEKRRNGKRIERKCGNLVLSRSPPLSSAKLIKLSDNTFTLELTVGKVHPNLFQSVIRISASLRLRLLRN